MKVVFFGSSSFSVPFLKGLKKDIVLVVTTPDKPQKRGRKTLPNPVKRKAVELCLPFLIVQNFTLIFKKRIESFSPDLFIVVSFGKIIPNYILSIVKYPLNLHPSKLPLYRGAAPVERQIMDGVKESAVSIMLMNEKLDRGSILVEQPFRILFTDTKENVNQKIIDIGIPLLKKAMAMVKSGNCRGIAQQGKGSYARKITKEDEIIHWESDAIKIYNKIRALYPVPASFTFLRGNRLKIFRADISNLDEGHPGEIIKLSKKGFIVKCGKRALLLREVQFEGKKRIKAIDFINGTRLKIGERLG